jgi:hypothetical protein
MYDCKGSKTGRLFMKTIIAIFLSFVLSGSAFAIENQPSKNIDCEFGGIYPVIPSAVKTQFTSEFFKIIQEDEENDLDLSGIELRRAIRKVRAQFILLSILQSLTFVPDGINLSVDFLGEDGILESDNLDDEEDDIKYTVRADFKNLKIINMYIPGKFLTKRDSNGIPVWNLTLMVEEIGTCADVEATADTTERENDGSYLDLIPEGTATASGEACLTIKNARVPVDVTIARDEDNEIVSKFTVIPPAREHELYEGSKKLEVDLDDLTAYDHVVSELILELLEPAVEDLLYKELDIDELLSEAAEEVLEIPLSFGDKQ